MNGALVLVNGYDVIHVVLWSRPKTPPLKSGEGLSTTTKLPPVRTSLGPRPPPFCALPFAFTIIHGIGRSAPVYYCERNGGGLGTRQASYGNRQLESKSRRLRSAMYLKV